MAAMAGSDLNSWQLLDMETLDTWRKGRTVLLGDSAHPFQPCKKAFSVFRPVLQKQYKNEKSLTVGLMRRYGTRRRNGNRRRRLSRRGPATRYSCR